MKDIRHILICGDVGVGKSTLIRRLLELNQRPVYGFVTKRWEAGADGFCPVHIFPAGGAKQEPSEANRVGSCDRRNRRLQLHVFDTLGVDYLQSPPDGLIVLDELGFMESQAKKFTQAVVQALAGDIPCLAAVKSRYDVEFLNQVRACPQADLFLITKENRDQLFEELAPRIAEWNQG